MSGLIRAPRTPEEIRDFIGHDFGSFRWGDKKTQAPHPDDTYTLTAHDLLSAFALAAEREVERPSPNAGSSSAGPVFGGIDRTTWAFWQSPALAQAQGVTQQAYPVTWRKDPPGSIPADEPLWLRPIGGTAGEDFNRCGCDHWKKPECPERGCLWDAARKAARKAAAR